MGISHSWNGTVLTITSDSGTSSADLRGEMGIRGPQGIPGEQFKPEKGVDYFTEEELLAIKEGVTAEVNTHVDAEVEAASNEMSARLDEMNAYLDDRTIVANDPKSDGNVVLSYGVVVEGGGGAGGGLTAEEVQAMINASLGVIENGTY